MAYFNKMHNLQDYQVSALARIFSPSVLKELSTYGRSPLLSRLVKDADIMKFFHPTEKLSALFDQSFNILKAKDFRHEYVYKAALTHKVLMGKHSLRTATMINEFRVGSSKADVVILNGTSTVYEIKSERDNLSKLCKQIEAYSKVFATVNVVLGENHINSAISILPDHVGIMTLSGRYQISTIRDADELPERTKVDAIFDSIQIKEAKKILVDLGYPIPNVPNTKQYQVLKEMFLGLTSLEAHDGMVNTLRNQRNSMSLISFVEQMPESLRTVTLTTKIPKREYDTLLIAINEPIYKAIA